MFEEEKIKIELCLADIFHRQKIKAEERKLKMKKIKKHDISLKIGCIMFWLM
jgi:hypothetical protein